MSWQHLQGPNLGVMATELGVFAFVGMLALAAWGIWSVMDEDKGTPAGKLSYQGAKRRGVRHMLGLAGVACMFMAVASSVALAKIGNLNRGCQTFGCNPQKMNWLMFVFTAVAFAFTGWLYAIFYHFTGLIHKLSLVMAFAGIAAAFGVAELSTFYYKRVVLYAFIILAQVVTSVLLFLFSRSSDADKPSNSLAAFRDMALTYQGIAVHLLIWLGWILYDIFWVIGYPNAPNNQTQAFHALWKSLLPFFFANMLIVMWAPAVACATYVPVPKSYGTDEDMLAQPSLPEDAVRKGGSALVRNVPEAYRYGMAAEGISSY